MLNLVVMYHICIIFYAESIVVVLRLADWTDGDWFGMDTVNTDIDE